MSKTTIPTGGITADAINATLIADDAISEEHLDATAITGHTALAEAPASTDEFLISDGGTLKRIDASYVGETNTPYARVGFSSAPSVNNGTLKIAEFGNILFASDNSIVDTTNYKITPGVAGKYYVAAHINYAPNAVDEKDYHLLLFKDTAVTIRTATLAAGNSNGRGTDVFLSGFVELTDSNYVQMKVFQNSGASAQYAYGDTTGASNYFELFRIAS